MSIVTANLGLVAWNLNSDDFESSQLANNWVKIDEHSHVGTIVEAEFDGEGDLLKGHWAATGSGLAIKTAAIEPFAIVKYLIASRAVGHLQLGLEQVWPENLKKESLENKHLANESITDRTIAHETITVDKLDPGILPLGTVVLWYRAKPEETPGDIWAVCDGRSWSVIPNAWGLTEGEIPDMRERFARGTTTGHTGETGGAPSVDLEHSHSITAASLNHTHVVGAHTHPIIPGGEHRHTFVGGFQAGSRKNALEVGLVLYGDQVNNLQSLYLEGFNEGKEGVNAPMDEAGLHAHSGATQGNSTFNTGSSSLSGSVTTNESLVGVETIPPYVGLCYVMRVL